MKNLIIAITTLLILFACSKDDDMAIPDSIAANLTSTEAAYESAMAGDWVEITAAEYNALLNNLNTAFTAGMNATDYSGTANTTYENVTITNTATNTIEPNHYLFAFKYWPGAGPDVVGAEVIISTSQTGNFTRLGNPLPTHRATFSSAYFVLKGSTSIVNNDRYLGIYTPGKIKRTLKPGLNYGNGKTLSTLPFHSTQVSALYQGIITAQKQWP